MLASVPLTVWSPGGPFVHAHNDKGLQVRRRLGRVALVDFPADVPVLTDGTVTLRAHRPDDAGAVLEQCTDPVSQRWTTVPVPYSPQDATRFVTETVPSGWTRGSWAFAVEACDENGVARFCGTVELRDEGNRRAEVAYGAHPWARGRGLMHRALTLLLDWGFEERGLRTLIWWANAGNWASRRLAWRLGFSCDGTLERWLPQRGDLVDAWFGVLHLDDPREPRHPWLSVPRLAGGQVVLRPFRDADVPCIVEACSDERTAYWLWRIPTPYTADDARTWLADRAEQLATGSAVTWAVADPRTDDLLGCINAFEILAGREAQLGWWVHPAARGRGVMTQACGLVLDHCFAPADAGGLGLVRVEVSAADGNTASRHVIERNGFRLGGRQRRALRLGDGSLTDLVVYDLLVEEQSAASVD
jgi:RimJ/RimL family protein N-acetyltransferase